MSIEQHENVSGFNVQLYTMKNKWMELTVSTFGCTITSIIIPGKDGVKRNIVLGYEEVAGYIDDPYYIGCVVGRYAGRISQASFIIDGQLYFLTANEGATGNHLHGGYAGFNKKNFILLSSAQKAEAASLVFYYNSPHLEEGYPGNLGLWVTYTLTNDNKIIIEYRAGTDHKTHINITNHTYFNFSGSTAPATKHQLMVNADAYVETRENYIPDGVIREVEGTVYDFRKKRRIDKFSDQLATGYNECFVLNQSDDVNAVLTDNVSGIQMSVTTSLPGLLLYTGDFLNGSFRKNQGICLETQFYPDSPHHPQFPSTLLIPGEEYVVNTVWAFNHE
ncbi:MAG TPA: aldose epimerase family protein [Flavitalea sp.]|nr:aldose epimerase family protein [Flavitalea sp.]